MKTEELQEIINYQDKLTSLETEVRSLVFIHPKQVKIYKRFLDLEFELFDFYVTFEKTIVLIMKHKDLSCFFELSRFEFKASAIMTVDYVMFSDVSDEDMFEILKKLSTAVDISFK